jgi:hypothetical protein
MPWLLAIVLSCVLPTSSSETIAQNDFRFISYHGELFFVSLLSSPFHLVEINTKDVVVDGNCDRNLVEALLLFTDVPTVAH